MKIEEITREVIPVLEWSEPIVSLAEEAVAVLGYKRLQQEREAPKQSGLIQQLANIQIDVLRRADVDTYKAERIVERTQEKLAEWCALPPNQRSQFWGPSWRQTEIDKYTEPIPEFVINKAIQIKKALPEVVILIEALEDYPDPFMVIAHRHPNYSNLYEDEQYVEVWAEPRFEGKLR